jgi:Squalene/phytoene synthase
MMKPATSDELYQDSILPQVSRSFALTIPQLPVELRTPVSNAYLLCRIADTIEDESALSVEDTLMSLQRFVSVVRGSHDARLLAKDLLPQLSRRTSSAERGFERAQDSTSSAVTSCGMTNCDRSNATVAQRPTQVQKRADPRLLQTPSPDPRPANSCARPDPAAEWARPSRVAHEII